MGSLWDHFGLSTTMLLYVLSWLFTLEKHLIGISMGSIWGHVAGMLASFWDHYGSILGSLCDQFAVMLLAFWDHSGILMGSFWDHSEIKLGSCCWHVGIILGSLWDHSGINLGSFIRRKYSDGIVAWYITIVFHSRICMRYKNMDS